MTTKYDVGDKLILIGTVKRIEQIKDGTVLYFIEECDNPVLEKNIVGKLPAEGTL